MEKQISIIVPVFNAYDTLFRCLKSLICQTFKDIEIICIDNGSNDKSSEVLENFAKKDSRIKIINKINDGYGSSCNIGINAASGKYLSIVETSGLCHKKMFDNLFKLAEKSEADIVKSPYYKITDTNNVKNGFEIQNKVDWNKRCKIPNWFFRINECPSFLSFHPAVFSSLYKKTFLNNNSIRFVEARGQNSFVDMPFYVESMLSAKKIVYTDNPYYCHRHKTFSFQNLEDCIFPFDRIEEVFQILIGQKNKDKNITANIYKRVLKLINIVFTALDREEKFDIKNMPYEVQLRIEKIISSLDEDIVNNNLFIDDFERRFFNLLTPNKIF